MGLFRGGVVRNQLVREGQVLVGSLFNEPMRVETARPVNGDTRSVGLVGVQSERYRSVTLTASDLQKLTLQETTCSYAGDSELLRLGMQRYMLGIAYECEPSSGLSISRVV